jgi:anion-transporting  ArsA/GET3 family ATPase
MKNVIGSGVKKLLSYLEKVTGPDFVSTFIEAVNAIYNNKAVFLNALRFQENIKSEEQCNWVLVTSTEHMKSEEALNMQKSVKDFIKARQFLAVNKVLETELEHWAPETTDMKKLKDSLVMRQQQVVDFARKNTGEYLGFPEIFALSPLEHLKVLVKTWGQHN